MILLWSCLYSHSSIYVYLSFLWNWLTLIHWSFRLIVKLKFIIWIWFHRDNFECWLLNIFRRVQINCHKMLFIIYWLILLFCFLSKSVIEFSNFLSCWLLIIKFIWRSVYDWTIIRLTLMTPDSNNGSSSSTIWFSLTCL